MADPSAKAKQKETYAGIKLRNTNEYGKMSIEEVFIELSSSESGISEQEAERRLSVLGYNEVEEAKENPIILFLKRFWGPMPWLLEVAIALSIVIAHYVEAAIIASLLTINAVIGYRHSQTSKKALKLLKSKLAVYAFVLRDGKWKKINARELVPGDIISVNIGDIVPADCKIIEGELSLDQSMLTGESLPVDVGKGSIAFSGSIVKRGKAKCIVVNTGKRTFFGKTVELVRVAAPKSHQQEILFAITKYMMYFGFVAMIIATVYAYYAHLKNDIISLLSFDIAILMGCVPVALPAVMTIMQAVGAIRLASHNVLVTKLESIENAALVDVIGLDKTGTITMNQLTVSEVFPLEGYEEKDVLLYAVMASSTEGKDAIDDVIVTCALKRGIKGEGYKVLSFLPFDPNIKRTEAEVEMGGKKIRVAKGAPQVILSMSKFSDTRQAELLAKKIEELSAKGYRLILVAKKEEGQINAYFEVVGLIALSDPPRPDSKELISELKKLGVRPKMLTGDNLLIAKEIAREVGIGDNIRKMDEVRGLPENDKAKVIEDADGFAEVYPEDKYDVVKLLQKKGHIVGMTGDGVNDAPALKQAEMGIAVSNATDAAKAAASVVLMIPGLKGIVEAIKVSREVYQRALSWVINKITKTIQFVLLLTLGFIWLKYDVISLLGMALLIFANDFATISLATDNVVSTINPNRWNVKNIVSSSAVLGFLLLAEGLLGIYIGVNMLGLTQAKLQTFVLLILVFTSQFRILIVRERRHFWSSMPGRELILSMIGVLIAFILLGTFGIIVPSVGLKASLIALGISAVFTLPLDPIKYYVFRKVGL